MNNQNPLIPSNSYPCPTCKSHFVMTGSHERWYIEKGLKVPTHCPACIKTKKEQKHEQLSRAN